MMLAGHELTELIQAGYINAPYNQVGTSSIDVRLGDTFLMETNPVDEGFDRPAIDPRNKTLHQFFPVTDKSYRLRPGEFILASTEEAVALPDNISCQFLLKSSIARCGINHLLAGWIDAGFAGNITLELHNVSRNPVLLTAGMKIGQLVFFKHVDTGETSYRHKGSYRGDKAKGTVASEGAK
jgi:dCTP deaminase